MKLIIKQQIEQEVEVTFPLSFATDSAYYHLYNADNGVAIWPRIGHINIVASSVALNTYRPELEVNKWEVEEVFNDVVKLLSGKFNTEKESYEQDNEDYEDFKRAAL